MCGLGVNETLKGQIEAEEVGGAVAGWRLRRALVRGLGKRPFEAGVATTVMAARLKRWMRTTANGRNRPRVSRVSTTLTSCSRAKARADIALRNSTPGKLVCDHTKLCLRAAM